MCTRELYNTGITSTKEEAGLVSGGKDWFPLFQGKKDLFRLVPGWEGLVSGWEGLVPGGFVWEGLVSGGFGSFCFLETTFID